MNAIASHSSTARRRARARLVDERGDAAAERLSQRAPGRDAEVVEHGEDVTGEQRERVVPVGVRGHVGATVGAEVDGDGPVPVGQAPRERVEEAGAEAVGVQQEQGLTGAAPVEGRDAQPVVLDDVRGGLAAQAAGVSARMRPSVSSWGVEPPSVSSSCLASRK